MGSNEKKEDCDSVYSYVEKMPSFLGGESEMMKYVYQNLKFPSDIDKVEDYSELMVASFVVSKTGHITDVKIKRSTNICKIDSTYIELIKSMPRWNAGEQNGKRVNVRYNLPLRVRLQF